MYILEYWHEDERVDSFVSTSKETLIKKSKEMMEDFGYDEDYISDLSDVLESTGEVEDDETYDGWYMFEAKELN